MSHHNRGHHNRTHNNQGNRPQHNRGAPGPLHQKEITVAQALASIEKFQNQFNNDQMQQDRIRESPNYKQEESLLSNNFQTALVGNAVTGVGLGNESINFFIEMYFLKLKIFYKLNSKIFFKNLDICSKSIII